MNKNSLLLAFLVLILGACAGDQSSRARSMGEEVAGVENPVVSLDGTWKFTLTPPENFWANEVHPAEWADIQVPGECLMQGFKIQPNVGYPFKTQVEIPEDFRGKKIFLRFDGVYSYARVWVNGQFVRDHHGGFTTWEGEITDLVEPGQNAWITVEVTDRDDEISYGSGYAHHLIGGILRDVSLVAMPQDHLSSLRVETNLDAGYRDAALKISAGVSFQSAEKAEVFFSLYDRQGARVRLKPSLLKLEKTNPQATFEIPVKAPLLWDAEHPNLYTLTALLRIAGNVVEKRSQRIGFRKIEIAGNRLLVNGQPVKLRGACRHDVQPLLGRRSTRDLDRWDALLAKEANINFIRTSHYPPSRFFLEFCDEYGIYVEEETAVCFVGTHRSPQYHKISFSQDDPAFTDRYLGQLKEMVDRDRNHPSVIIWSIGNENLYGTNFQKEFDWVKKADSTRPVMFSYPGHVPKGTVSYDILSMHYPTYEGDLTQGGIVADGFSCGPTPVIFDEWAHVSCYNQLTLHEDPNVRNFWGESLKKFWDMTFESEAVGGAIWGMIDEVFLLPDQAVGYGEWGIIDGWRRKKPEFWHTKKAYSPVRVLQTEVKAGPAGQPLRIPVYNRFDHTNLRELNVKWARGVQSGTMAGPDIPPHGQGEILIPAAEGKAGDTALVQFFQGRRLVDEEIISVGGRTFERPPLKTGVLKVEEKGQEILVSGPSFSFTVSRTSGLLQDGRIGEEQIIAGGPYLFIRALRADPAGNQDTFWQTNPESWKLDKMEWRRSGEGIEVKVSGAWDMQRARLGYLISGDGSLTADFELLDIPGGTPAELGIAFDLKEAAWIEWERKGLWSAYPDDHIGRLRGRALLGSSAEQPYRQEPTWSWSMDVWDYFLSGLNPPSETSLLLSNDAKSLKENIWSYMVGFESGAQRLLVEAQADRAARLKSLGDGRLRLIILTAWDYPDLEWGNYMRHFKFEDNPTGKVTIRLVP